jgi:catechol 2,3-dioxygenase-like lactoylglutathione lyase family enzyme
MTVVQFGELPAPPAQRALRHTATSHLALRVPDVPTTSVFYQRIVGLQVHAELPDGGVRLGWGTGHHVLDLLPGERGLDHLAFEVAEHERLGLLREGLGAAGGRVDPLAPATGLRGFATSDPDGNEIWFHEAVDRSGEAYGGGARRPVRYQHATFATADLPAMLDFYVAQVGFRLSDLMGEEFGWLRSSADHHSLAAVASGGHGLDHFSFDVVGWEDLRTWCDRLTAEGVDVTWGPGRHGPGNNLFIMFDDPAGNHIELSAEMEQFHDEQADHPTRRWRPVPRSINLWGGQLAAWRTTSEGD